MEKQKSNSKPMPGKAQPKQQAKKAPQTAAKKK